MEAGYSTDFGPLQQHWPKWSALSPRQKNANLEDLVANLDLPSVEALEAGGALAHSIAFLSAEDL